MYHSQLSWRNGSQLVSYMSLHDIDFFTPAFCASASAISRYPVLPKPSVKDLLQSILANCAIPALRLTGKLHHRLQFKVYNNMDFCPESEKKFVADNLLGKQDWGKFVYIKSCPAPCLCNAISYYISHIFYSELYLTVSFISNKLL